MSSDDGQSNQGPQQPEKRRRLQRSCDICRKRKIRCDSANMPNGRCTSCISFNAVCLHTEPVRKRGPKNKHVEELQQQLTVLEAKLRTVQPDSVTASAALPSTSVIKYPPPVDASPSPPSLPEEDISHDELAERFRQFELGSLKHRFFGSSSGFMLMKNAIAIKEEYLGRPIVSNSRRPEFWNIRPWEEAVPNETPRYIFPDPDLMTSLLEIYFTNVQPTLPLLHRPTFEKSLAEGLHLTDFRFGGTVLALLSVASRYSDDPRVFVPGSNSALSSGWIFFNQVQVIRKSLFDEPSIYEVQLYCLITLFTLGTSSPQASWLYLGLGIRFIQERGEHRRKREGHKFTVEDELWKRAFWCLLSLDRTVCSFLGRPSAIHVEDYDVELPIEVDDEYWDHPDPEQRFKQPPGKPSVITFFVCHIRLCEILGSTLRRLYASNKSRVLMGLVGTDWEQRAVSELDSAMNDFLRGLPDHLRWDPNRQTGVFFDQSCVLHAMYYNLQITIHRPYIQQPSVLAFPSLAVITSAARSSIHVVDVWITRLQRLALPYVQTGVFVAGVVLLLNLFGVKRAGLPIDVGKELAHVSTAMRILKFQETRWQSAGRLWELLQELQSWDGPPAAKSVTPKPKEIVKKVAEPAVEVDFTPIDMCPFKRKAMQEAMEQEKAREAMFPSSADTPQLSDTTSTIYSMSPIADESSPHSMPPESHQPPPTMDLWSDLAPSNNPITAEQAGMSIEQLLAATAEYDNATGLAKSVDHWSDTTGLANMLIDDNLMSMWGDAPNHFGNLADWDAYIETKNGPAFNWSTHYDPQMIPSAPR
ncbi:fungal-specific transcription factor domain-containing protein [Mycena galopus ATCC 62051]|nr:fungal-specific transcription factor domain-containing protein [Mycena galopus ATCC 62051]